MISAAGQRLVAIVETLAPILDDSQVEIAISCLMRLAGQGSTRAEAERRRKLAERAYEEERLTGPALARRGREPA